MTSRLNAAAPLVLRDFDLDFLSGRRSFRDVRGA